MAARKKPVAVSHPLFNLLLIIVVGTGGMTFLTMIALAFWAPDPMSKAQERLLVICEYAFMTCLGAVVGLLGGRAARPDYLGDFPPSGDAAVPPGVTSITPPEAPVKK